MNLLARLYWYMVEFGLIRTRRGLRAFGAGILSSHGELSYSVDSAVPNRIRFDPNGIMRTDYMIDSFQKTYFVLDSFDELFGATQRDFAAIYDRLREQTVLPAETILTRPTSSSRKVAALIATARCLKPRGLAMTCQSLRRPSLLPSPRWRRTSGTIPWAPTGSNSWSTRRPIRKRSAGCSRPWASRAVARHRSKNVTLYRQGDVNFIVNAEPQSFAQIFARAHGPSVCAMAFRVADAA